MIIGPNQAAIMFEIGVVDGVPAPVVVHAMRARNQIPEVIDMARSIQDIRDHADELARPFETYEPAAEDERDATLLAALRDAALSRSDAERSIRSAVDDARAHGYSWAVIGSLLGTSGEAARQRYGTKQQA